MGNYTKETGHHAVVRGTPWLQVKQGVKTQKSSELRSKQSHTEGHLKEAPGLCQRRMESDHIQQLSCWMSCQGHNSCALASVLPCCLAPPLVSD